MSIIRRGTNSFPFHTPVSSPTLETPRIATSGALIALTADGTEWWKPNHPAFRQRSTSRAFGDGGQFTGQLGHALLIHVFGAGTTGPFGVSTATPMLMYFSKSKTLTVFGRRRLLKRGICSRAAATAFHDEDRGVYFTSSLRFSASAFCCLRNASRSSRYRFCREVRNVRDHHPVTRLRFAPEIFWIRPSSLLQASQTLLKSLSATAYRDTTARSGSRHFPRVGASFT